MPPRAAWAMMTRQARRPSAIQHDTVRCGFLSQRSYVAPSPRSHTAPKWPRKELTYCPIYGFKSCVICTKDLTPELFCGRPVRGQSHPLQRWVASARRNAINHRICSLESVEQGLFILVVLCALRWAGTLRCKTFGESTGKKVSVISICNKGIYEKFFIPLESTDRALCTLQIFPMPYFPTPVPRVCP